MTQRLMNTTVLNGKRFLGAVFDMDGTLADTEPLHFDAYRHVARDLGFDMTEHEYDQFTGKTDAAICQYLVERHSLSLTVGELLANKESVLRTLLCDKLRPLPGVIATLTALRSMGVKMAVASSSTLETINLILDVLNIRPFFDAIASGEEVASTKPAPDVFLLAAQRLGIRSKLCLAFEDSENGAIAAKAAGMFCIAIPCSSTLHQDHSAAHIKVATMAGVDVARLVLAI